MDSSIADIGVSMLRLPPLDDVVFLALIILLSIGYSLKGIAWGKPDPYHHLWFDKPQSDVAGTKNAETRDIGLKLEQKNKNGVIFWGSQSGTAEGLANQLVRDCRARFSLDMIAADLSDYEPESIQNIPVTKFAIFIVSTYGEGDPSDNATQLLSWLRANSNINFPITMPNLRYAAFGLGNSNYKFYNRVIDVITDALDQFQAKALLPTGRADDSTGSTAEDFTEWKQELFSMFRNKLNYEERPEKYEPSLRVVEDTSLDAIDLHTGEPVRPRNFKKASTTSCIQPLLVKVAKPLLSSKDRNCLHIEIDTSEHPKLKYKTGDHLAIWPANPKSEVNRLIQVLGLNEHRDVPLLISDLDPSIQTKVPSPTNLESLFRHYLEICGPVPREIILSIAQFAVSPSTKAFLRNLGSSKDTYNDYCTGTHMSLSRLLESAILPTEDWSHLPLSFVIEILSPLQPRLYSVSSSSIVSPHIIALTISTTTAIVSPNSSIPAQINGITTRYLNALSESTHSPQSCDYDFAGPNDSLARIKIFASISPSKFRLPVNPQHPLILVASGSGIAPFRGFLQERARLAKLGREVGSMILFFGCRSESEFIYSDEFAVLHSELGNKLEIVTAFSRAGREKVYVQDRIEERIGEIATQLIDDNVHFYICGSASMARGVGLVVAEGIKKKMSWEEADLRDWSERMRRNRRWQEDVWG